MSRLALASSLLLLAACASGTSERMDKIENKLQGQILKSNRLEEDQQKLAERLAADLEKMRKDLKALRDEMDLLRTQLAAVKKTATGPTAAADVEAEKAAQEEVEYIRRSPKSEETLAAAVKRLKPVSAGAAPILVMELKQAMKRADLPVAGALEKVLAGLDPEVAVRCLLPELDQKQTRVIAAGVLGQIGHTSAREPLAKHLGDADFAFRFAVAEALVKLKGQEGKKAIPVLIEALKPTRRNHNIVAYDLLHRLTTFSFGYKMFGPDEEKMASAAKWQEWWDQHGDTFEFSGP
jgi:HEAT repeat protein